MIRICIGEPVTGLNLNKSNWQAGGHAHSPSCPPTQHKKGGACPHYKLPFLSMWPLELFSRCSFNYKQSSLKNFFKGTVSQNSCIVEMVDIDMKLRKHRTQNKHSGSAPDSTFGICIYPFFNSGEA